MVPGSGLIETLRGEAGEGPWEWLGGLTIGVHTSWRGAKLDQYDYRISLRNQRGVGVPLSDVWCSHTVISACEHQVI